MEILCCLIAPAGLLAGSPAPGMLKRKSLDAHGACGIIGRLICAGILKGKSLGAHGACGIIGRLICAGNNKEIL